MDRNQIRKNLVDETTGRQIERAEPVGTGTVSGGSLHCRRGSAPLPPLPDTPPTPYTLPGHGSGADSPNPFPSPMEIVGGTRIAPCKASRIPPVPRSPPPSPISVPTLLQKINKLEDQKM
ncbi:hypothetical protein SLEP1_g44966 [Rubroshorea leprosula]|uniref:Uncharacterized protein n=1 Tax=Rubroshorea leprosula TaxID=152421 RepID=A0AAV5LK08_9ROSI|nr:hypothetical protein SLEP1_g44966 [Rubroshorea leprosula]